MQFALIFASLVLGVLSSDVVILNSANFEQEVYSIKFIYCIYCIYCLFIYLKEPCVFMLKCIIIYLYMYCTICFIIINIDSSFYWCHHWWLAIEVLCSMVCIRAPRIYIIFHVYCVLYIVFIYGRKCLSFCIDRSRFKFECVHNMYTNFAISGLGQSLCYIIPYK